jgi:hypothetical protein
MIYGVVVVPCVCVTAVTLRVVELEVVGNDVEANSQCCGKLCGSEGIVSLEEEPLAIDLRTRCR